MDFFDRHKALIITVLLFSVMFLALYNIRIYNSNKEFSEMLVQLPEYQPEKVPEEKEPEKEEMQPEKPAQSIKTHQAFNRNREESEAEFQDRIEEIFEENSAKNKATDEAANTSKGEFNIPVEKEEEKRERSEGNDSSEETSVKRGSMRNSSISFSLLGREAVDIPNPIYTCDTPGRIVVNIIVNEEGQVIETSINEASSSTTNECLTNQAMQYAANAVFTNLPGKNTQKGTITYNFQD